MKILAEITRIPTLGGYCLDLIKLDNLGRRRLITEIDGDLKGISAYYTGEWEINIAQIGNNANNLTFFVDLIQKGD